VNFKSRLYASKALSGDRKKHFPAFHRSVLLLGTETESIVARRLTILNRKIKRKIVKSGRKTPFGINASRSRKSH
jgi:hypothetical protein